MFQAEPGSLVVFREGLPHRNWNEGPSETVHLAINSPLFPDPNRPISISVSRDQGTKLTEQVVPSAPRLRTSSSEQDWASNGGQGQARERRRPQLDEIGARRILSSGAPSPMSR